jgi:hypothetical protein
MVGIPCLVSQSAKLHVAGLTWTVFTRVCLELCTWPVAKQQRVDVCTDDETLLSRVITGDLAPCDFFLFPKMKSKRKWRRFDTIEEFKTESQRVLDSDRKGLPGNVLKMEETVGPVSTCGRVMTADRPDASLMIFTASVRNILNTTSYNNPLKAEKRGSTFYPVLPDLTKRHCLLEGSHASTVYRFDKSDL